MRNHVHISE